MGVAGLRVVRSRESRVCFGHVKYKMPVRHPSGKKIK